MSDSDELDLDGGEAAGLDNAPKKTSGLGALLPNILKFVAIGLGAVAIIVTVVVITINVLNSGGKSQTSTADPTSPYAGRRMELAPFTLIGPVTTKTRDVTNYSVTVEMVIEYDLNDSVTQTELTSRQYELRDFVRSYFSSKHAADLQPEGETRIKQEIKEILNTRILDTAKVRNILFTKLDVMEAY
jgi:flagellar FliL protein